MQLRTCLSLNDVVLVNTGANEESNAMGIIRYIGSIYGHDMTEFVGIELLEALKDAHDGTINNYQYFQTPPHHGWHVKLTSIIKKLPASDVMLKMRQVLNLFTTKLEEYVSALQRRDNYIEKLKREVHSMHQKIKSLKKCCAFNQCSQSTTTRSAYFDIEQPYLRTPAWDTNSSFDTSNPITPITPSSQNNIQLYFPSKINNDSPKPRISDHESMKNLTQYLLNNNGSRESMSESIHRRRSSSAIENISKPSSVPSPTEKDIEIIDNILKMNRCGVSYDSSVNEHKQKMNNFQYKKHRKKNYSHKYGRKVKKRQVIFKPDDGEIIPEEKRDMSIFVISPDYENYQSNTLNHSEASVVSPEIDDKQKSTAKELQVHNIYDYLSFDDDEDYQQYTDDTEFGRSVNDNSITSTSNSDTEPVLTHSVSNLLPVTSAHLPEKQRFFSYEHGLQGKQHLNSIIPMTSPASAVTYDGHTPSSGKFRNSPTLVYISNTASLSSTPGVDCPPPYDCISVQRNGIIQQHGFPVTSFNSNSRKTLVSSLSNRPVYRRQKTQPLQSQRVYQQYQTVVCNPQLIHSSSVIPHESAHVYRNNQQMQVPRSSSSEKSISPNNNRHMVSMSGAYFDRNAAQFKFVGVQRQQILHGQSYSTNNIGVQEYAQLAHVQNAYQQNIQGIGDGMRQVVEKTQISRKR